MSGCDDFPASSSHNRMIANLSTPHEEAHTKKLLCMPLMLMHRALSRLVVNTRDTDIPIVLIHHDIPIEVWMNSSKSKEKR